LFHAIIVVSPLLFSPKTLAIPESKNKINKASKRARASLFVISPYPSEENRHKVCKYDLMMDFNYSGLEEHQLNLWQLFFFAQYQQ
jgi:hypothetical protein